MGLMLNNQPIKGEVHLGKQTIGKMYYNHELVYENMLASGTVLFYDSNQRTLKTNKDNIIALNEVSSDWSNVKNGIRVSWAMAKLDDDIYSDVTKEQLESGYEIRKPYGSVGMNIKIANGNSINLHTPQTGTRVLRKITAL